MSVIRIFILLVALCLPSMAVGELPGIVGRWQYIQPPDTEGEILDLWESGGHYRGIMNGLERTGEHGLFYFVAEVQNLRISPDGRISFVVGERSFFVKRPQLSVLGATGDGGYTREPMRFEGRLNGVELVLSCSDSGGSCPDEILRFRRIGA